MGLAIIYCAGFIAFFYIFMLFYVSERYDGFTEDSLAEATMLAALIAIIWPAALIIMLFIWLGKVLA